jgi:acetoin utilization deacetylase AcuC-like enzyme
MPAGCGDAEYVGALARLLVPVALQYQPQMILVSCGFDAHRDDPLASMDVTEAGYRAMTQIVRSLADEICDGRILFVLEGGYASSGLLDGSRAVLATMSSVENENTSDFHGLEPSRTLRSILERAASVHGGRCPGIGTG